MVPDLVRVAKAKLPVVEVVEERRVAMCRAVEPQAPPGLTELGEGKKDELWEVEDGSHPVPEPDGAGPAGQARGAPLARGAHLGARRAREGGPAGPARGAPR